ncbi:hypothetical protein MTO96_022231 [Rhipicephalus appendiculatus]
MRGSHERRINQVLGPNSGLLVQRNGRHHVDVNIEHLGHATTRMSNVKQQQAAHAAAPDLDVADHDGKVKLIIHHHMKGTPQEYTEFIVSCIDTIVTLAMKVATFIH